MIRVYEDIKKEIKGYEEELEALEIREDRLLKILNNGQPRDIKAMAYDSSIRGSSNDTTINRTLGRLDIVRQLIVQYTELLELAREDFKKQDNNLKEFTGLKYEVYYRRIHGKSYQEIGDELGYSRGTLWNLMSKAGLESKR